MIFRTVLITSCLVLVSCGGQSKVNTTERLEQVENNCSMLASQASFDTGETAPTNFCYCMVQLLEERPDVHIDAISQTFAVVAEEHLKSGDSYSDIASSLQQASSEAGASDRSKALGIGINLVGELTSEVSERAKAGRC